MTEDKVFVDTNVLVYAHNSDEAVKHDQARRQIAQLWQESRGVISTQILQELFVTVTRKIPRPLDRSTARSLLQVYRPWVARPTTAEDVLRATEIEELDRISFWDALVVVSASRAGASVLLTEDLDNGQVIEGVRIENPFV